MNDTHSTFSENIDAAGANAQKDEVKVSRYLGLGFAIFLVGALLILTSLFVSSGVSDVSAAARGSAEQPVSQVPYFPSLYVNQGTEDTPQPATF